MAINVGRNLPPPNLSYSEVVRLQDLEVGDHPFRFIEGGDVQETMMWPTQAWNDEQGQMVSTWRPVRLPLDNRHTILDKLSSYERKIRQAVAARDGHRPENCVFDRRRTNCYVVFHRGAEEVKPIIFEISSYGVVEAICGFHTKKDPDDPTYLLYGPFQFYDIVVSKVLQPKKAGMAEWQRIRYKAEVSPKNEWAGRVPVEWAQAIPEGITIRTTHPQARQAMTRSPANMKPMN